MSPEPPGRRQAPSEHYSREYYLESCGGAEFFRLYGPKVLKPGLALALERAELKPGLKALEVGCGRGELLYHLKKLGVDCVGTDFSEAAAAMAARVSGASVVRCDAQKLPFPDHEFDRIFFMGVMDHLHDGELEACFGQFRRLLKPGGFVLANTCANKQYYKRLTYGLRRELARRLGLRRPAPPRSDEDELLHVNEHDERGLREFFLRIGWRGDIEPRANDKYYLEELYGSPLPDDFPLKPAAPWKALYLKSVFRGPLKRYLAREFFCKLLPI